MAANMLVVGSRLPHGLILEHPADPKNTVEILGKNKTQIIGAEYMTTRVDAEFMNAWLAANKEFGAVKSGALFVVKSENDAVAAAKEVAEQETGFEPMRTDGKDKRARGTKTASDKE